MRVEQHWARDAPPQPLMVWNLSEANKFNVVVSYDMLIDDDACCQALGKVCQLLTADLAEDCTQESWTLVCT